MCTIIVIFSFTTHQFLHIYCLVRYFRVRSTTRPYTNFWGRSVIKVYEGSMLNKWMKEIEIFWLLENIFVSPLCIIITKVNDVYLTYVRLVCYQIVDRSIGLLVEMRWKHLPLSREQHFSFFRTFCRVISILTSRIYRVTD